MAKLLLQPELESYTNFINENSEKITTYAKYLKTSGDYQVFNNRLAYDIFRAYWQQTYKQVTYASVYNKYNCNDSHVLSFALYGLKKSIIVNILD